MTGIGGPAGTADFVLFHSAILEINFCAWLRYTEPPDMHIFLRKSASGVRVSVGFTKQKSPKRGYFVWRASGDSNPGHPA